MRFQAYLVGLPKTGSTSVATIFAGYRTAHEWQMGELLDAALPWAAGEIDEEEFWRSATPRLTAPVLEMDSATCHHLYADLLVRRFPKAVFVHTVRDVGSWLSSLLDMAMRYHFARGQLGVAYSAAELRYIDLMTQGVHDPLRDPALGDDGSIVPLMRYWAGHMRGMAEVLPRERTLVVRSSDLPDRLDRFAELCRIDVGTLRADLSHSNRAEVRFDRLAAFATDDVRQAYDRHCAEIMADMFPHEHARITAWESSGQSWQEHVAATAEHMREAVAIHGDRVAR